jgi:hypothetical protein
MRTNLDRKSSAKRAIANMLSPKEIKSVASRLTGLEFQEPVKVLQSPGSTRYEIRSVHGTVTCVKTDRGWLCAELDDERQTRTIWSDYSEEPAASESGRLAIEAFFEKHRNLAIHPRFVKQESDIRANTQRKTYVSDLGTVVVHSRPTTGGTEVFLHLVKADSVYRFEWLRESGELIFDREVERVPF